MPWYTAAISVLNNMVWSGIALLSFFVAWRLPNERRRLVLFGGFVLVLAADDTLLLHDAVGPNNGVPQEAFLVVYAVTAALLSVVVMRGPDRGVLLAFVLGAALLAVSVVYDQLLADQHLIEDGAKLLGALVWLTVPVIACPDVLEPGTPRGCADS